MTTPKIIHFLWIDFKKKKGCSSLDYTLTFFKNRIEELHPVENGWTINFINNWDECLASIKGEKWLIDLVNNEFVGPAHKSDALRYHYLYTMGGVWIDISTFLVVSLDNLVNENKDGFTCYYMPSDVCASWLIKLTSDIFENITAKEYRQNIIPEQKHLVDIKNTSFDFITENYFLISSKGNEISKNVLDQLKDFWTIALPLIKNKDNYIFECNKLIYKLLQEVYNINNKGFPYLDLVDLKSKGNKNLNNIILKEYFKDGYFFNYLQLYLAILNYSINNKGTLKNIENSENKEQTIALEKLNDFSKELCENDSCNNKIICFTNKNKNINLLSAAYNRLSKYSDNRDHRISWEDTLAGDILKLNEPFDKILNMLRLMEITQLKYSSYTRNKSISINTLKRLFIGYDKSGIRSKAVLIEGGRKNKKANLTKIKQKEDKKYKGPQGGIYIIKNGRKKYL
jgi:hypothetical protein